MKILLDENMPKKVCFRLLERPGVTDVRTVREMGWNGRKNGELLGLLTLNGFDTFITIDKSLYKQQNLEKFSITVIVLNVKTTKYEDIQPAFQELYTLLEQGFHDKLIIITPA
jgi:hypothetical protein